MVDLATQAAYSNALQAVGQLVTFRRIAGDAPNTVVVDAQVMADIKQRTRPGPAIGVTGKEGAITQNTRIVIVLACDLAAKGFPLPVKKNDKIVSTGGEVLNITDVDPDSRQYAGAIELWAVGI